MEATSDLRANALPWHREELLQMQGLMSRQKMPQALVLYGNTGIGKSSFARSLVALLLCQEPRADTACEQCKTCLLRRSGNHLDIHNIEPETEGKIIGIDAIRSLVDKVYTKPTQTGWLGAWKVVIIHSAQSMNIQSANSLLKMLEEPPPSTLFILLTEYLQLLLPTIRSRCQQKLLPAPSHSVARHWLQEQSVNGKAMDADTVEQLLHYYPQQPLEALRIYAQEELEARFQMTDFCIQSAEGSKSIFDIAAQLSQNSQSSARLLSWFYEEVHLILKQQTLSEGTPYRLIEAMYPLLHQTLHENYSSHINPKLMWETLLLQWQTSNKHSSTPEVEEAFSR